MMQKLSRYLPTLGSIAVGFLPATILVAHFGVPRKLMSGMGGRCIVATLFC